MRPGVVWAPSPPPPISLWVALRLQASPQEIIKFWVVTMKLKGILKFYCLCKSGCCCHIIATIWMLDEYSRKNLVQATSSKSKTSKPQAWGIPNQKRKITHEPVMETKVVRPKHISDAVPKKQQGLTSTLFDPRPVGKQGLDINGLNEMSEKLKKNGLNIPYARMVPSIEKFKVTTTVVGVVAQRSLLDVQLKNARLQSSVSVNEVSNTTFRFTFEILQKQAG